MNLREIDKNSIDTYLDEILFFDDDPTGIPCLWGEVNGEYGDIRPYCLIKYEDFVGVNVANVTISYQNKKYKVIAEREEDENLLKLELKKDEL